jgi:hypothetical protein
LNLLAETVFPSIQTQRGSHEIAATVALAGAFLTGALVYTFYPRRKQRRP